MKYVTHVSCDVMYLEQACDAFEILLVRLNCCVETRGKSRRSWPSVVRMRGGGVVTGRGKDATKVLPLVLHAC